MVEDKKPVLEDNHNSKGDFNEEEPAKSEKEENVWGEAFNAELEAPKEQVDEEVKETLEANLAHVTKNDDKDFGEFDDAPAQT